MKQEENHIFELYCYSRTEKKSALVFDFTSVWLYA